jgi:hypothetical protein
MDLVEWTSIPEERQRELIIRWSKDVDQWFEYQDMADKAAAGLRKELSAIPEITNVEVEGGKVLHVEPTVCVCELALNVCTLLPESSRLEHIPSRFAGFSVHQLNLGDKRMSFLRTWKRLFQELKGWDERTTLIWAQKWDDALSGRRPAAIYHYGPVKMALSSLVDENVKAAAGNRLQHLYNDIRNVIERTEDVSSQRIEHPDTVEKYDWGYVRRRLAELVEEYGKKVA